MSQNGNAHNGEAKTSELLTCSREFFSEVVEDACRQTRFQTFAPATNYLVELLLFYVSTDNLFDESAPTGKKYRETLAELFLKAANAQRRERVELLKKLGDTALYVSGFFGESLQRKIVDLDYYMEMGETAYGNLASYVSEDLSARVFREFSQNFVGFVDVLSYISSKSIKPMSNNLLQLFETYVATGSETAKDQILEKGLITIPVGTKKYKQ